MCCAQTLPKEVITFNTHWRSRSLNAGMIELVQWKSLRNQGVAPLSRLYLLRAERKGRDTDR